jgi:hypothetical protein
MPTTIADQNADSALLEGRFDSNAFRRYCVDATAIPCNSHVFAGGRSAFKWQASHAGRAGLHQRFPISRTGGPAFLGKFD